MNHRAKSNRIPKKRKNEAMARQKRLREADKRRQPPKSPKSGVQRRLRANGGPELA